MCMQLVSLLCIFSYIDHGIMEEGKSIKSGWPLKGQHKLERASSMVALALSLLYIIYYNNLCSDLILSTFEESGTRRRGSNASRRPNPAHSRKLCVPVKEALCRN